MNKKPVLSGSDGGVKRRLRNIRFPYNFVQNPTKENEKLMDKSISEEFKNDVGYHQQFMLILLERYRLYRLNNYVMHTPQRVIDETNEYLDENNHVKNFVADIFEEANDKKVLYSEVCDEFKIWSKGENVQLSKANLKEGLKELGFDVHKSKARDLYREKLCVFGLTYKNDDDIPDDYD
jgi:phage/plasmid-associated DNA primase